MKKAADNYNDAMTELEAIVSQVENNQMDIDHLSQQLRRAKELIGFCRDRLTRVDNEVKKIFEDDEAASSAEPQDLSAASSPSDDKQS